MCLLISAFASAGSALELPDPTKAIGSVEGGEIVVKAAFQNDAADLAGLRRTLQLELNELADGKTNVPCIVVECIVRDGQFDKFWHEWVVLRRSAPPGEGAASTNARVLAASEAYWSVLVYQARGAVTSDVIPEYGTTSWDYIVLLSFYDREKWHVTAGLSPWGVLATNLPDFYAEAGAAAALQQTSFLMTVLHVPGTRERLPKLSRRFWDDVESSASNRILSERCLWFEGDIGD